MPFDIEQFTKDAPYITPATRDVRVEPLKHWFPEDEEPILKIRGLTAIEIWMSSNLEGRAEIMRDIGTAIMTAVGSDRIDAFMEIIGNPANAPFDLARRFDWLMYGIVHPKISREQAVLLFATFPTVAADLSVKINQLTDDGPDLGKVPSFTEMPAS